MPKHIPRPSRSSLRHSPDIELRAERGARKRTGFIVHWANQTELEMKNRLNETLDEYENPYGLDAETHDDQLDAIERDHASIVDANRLERHRDER